MQCKMCASQSTINTIQSVKYFLYFNIYQNIFSVWSLNKEVTVFFIYCILTFFAFFYEKGIFAFEDLVDPTQNQKTF